MPSNNKNKRAPALPGPVWVEVLKYTIMESAPLLLLWFSTACLDGRCQFSASDFSVPWSWWSILFLIELGVMAVTSVAVVLGRDAGVQ